MPRMSLKDLAIVVRKCVQLRFVNECCCRMVDYWKKNLCTVREKIVVLETGCRMRYLYLHIKLSINANSSFHAGKTALREYPSLTKAGATRLPLFRESVGQ
jgi:hypothetical protein